MSSQSKRQVKGLFPTQGSYKELMKYTEGVSKASDILFKDEDNQYYVRCAGCQDWYFKDEHHCQTTHLTFDIEELWEAHQTKLRKKIKSGKSSFVNVHKVSPMLKATKALLFDIEAAMGNEAVISGENWREPWIVSLRGVTMLSHLQKSVLELQDKINKSFIKPNFDQKWWQVAVSDAISTKEVYDLLLELDSSILYEPKSPHGAIKKAYPPRKMARPELAVKWGYTPGLHYKDNSADIIGEACYVQDGRLVVKVLLPPQLKGKFRRYTMTQAKQHLTPWTASRSIHPTPTNESTERGSSVRKRQSKPPPSVQINMLSRAEKWGYPGDKEFIDKATKTPVTIHGVQDGRLLVEILGNTRRYTRSQASTALERLGSDDSDSNNSIQDDDEQGTARQRTALQDKKGTRRPNRNSASSNTKNANSMEIEDDDMDPELRGLLSRHKAQCNASRIVNEGNSRKMQLMMEGISTTGDHHLYVAKSLVVDMIQAISGEDIDSKFDQDGLIKRVVSCSAARQLSACVLAVEKAVKRERIRRWHESELWQTQCRNVRKSERLMDLVLRLDSAIKYKGATSDAEELSDSMGDSSSPKNTRNGHNNNKRRPNRPDLAIKWGYTPDSEYYDTKLKKVGTVLYVQAGNLIVDFKKDKLKRYNTDMARRFLRKATSQDADQVSDSDDNSGSRSRRPRRPTDGTHFKYSDKATYIDSIRSWSMEWISYVPTSMVVWQFGKAALLRGPKGDFGVWMLLRKGEGRGARSIAYLLDLNSHEVGWVELSAIGECKQNCESKHVAEMKEWVSKLKRKALSIPKIKPSVRAKPRSSNSGPSRHTNNSTRTSNKRERTYIDPERPLRRSRRQEDLQQRSAEDIVMALSNGGTGGGGGSRVPKKHHLIIASLRARIENLEAHNQDLIVHNCVLEERFARLKSGGDPFYIPKFRGQATTGTGIWRPNKDVKDVAIGASHGEGRGGDMGGIAVEMNEEEKGVEAMERVVVYGELLSFIMSFLDLRDRARTAAVSSLWNTPLVNHDITKIDFLKMRKCVTDRVVLSVACRHTEVTTLCLEFCEKLTDAGVHDIAEHYNKELAFVNISYCPLLTDNAIRSLSQCRNLKTLIVLGCDSISRKALRNLQTDLRNLDIYPAV